MSIFNVELQKLIKFTLYLKKSLFVKQYALQMTILIGLVGVTILLSSVNYVWSSGSNITEMKNLLRDDFYNYFFVFKGSGTTVADFLSRVYGRYGFDRDTFSFVEDVYLTSEDLVVDVLKLNDNPDLRRMTDMFEITEKLEATIAEGRDSGIYAADVVCFYNSSEDQSAQHFMRTRFGNYFLRSVPGTAPPNESIYGVELSNYLRDNLTASLLIKGHKTPERLSDVLYIVPANYAFFHSNVFSLYNYNFRNKTDSFKDRYLDYIFNQQFIPYLKTFAKLEELSKVRDDSHLMFRNLHRQRYSTYSDYIEENLNNLQRLLDTPEATALIEALKREWNLKNSVIRFAEGRVILDYLSFYNSIDRIDDEDIIYDYFSDYLTYFFKKELFPYLEGFERLKEISADDPALANIFPELADNLYNVEYDIDVIYENNSSLLSKEAAGIIHTMRYNWGFRHTSIDSREFANFANDYASRNLLSNYAAKNHLLHLRESYVNQIGLYLPFKTDLMSIHRVGLLAGYSQLSLDRDIIAKLRGIHEIKIPVRHYWKLSELESKISSINKQQLRDFVIFLTAELLLSLIFSLLFILLIFLLSKKEISILLTACQYRDAAFHFFYWMPLLILFIIKILSFIIAYVGGWAAYSLSWVEQPISWSWELLFNSLFMLMLFLLIWRLIPQKALRDIFSETKISLYNIKKS